MNNWMLRACIGPTLWAIAFAAIYALHGWGCARAWPSTSTPLGNLHSVVLISAFAVALLITGWALLRVPRGDGPKATIIATGGWIGFGGTLLTLFPVLGVSSCW